MLKFFSVNWVGSGAKAAGWPSLPTREAAELTNNEMPRQGDIVAWGDGDAIVTRVHADYVTLMETYERQIQPSSAEIDALDAMMQYQFAQQQIQPMIPSDIPECPLAIPTEYSWQQAATTRSVMAQHSDEWVANHSIALAKLMVLYKGCHSEPLHDIPASELMYLVDFARMYADAKESGLFDIWDALNLGQLNPFAFLEHTASAIPERLPRRIILRRRPA